MEEECSCSPMRSELLLNNKAIASSPTSPTANAAIRQRRVERGAGCAIMRGEGGDVHSFYAYR